MQGKNVLVWFIANGLAVGAMGSIAGADAGVSQREAELQARVEQLESAVKDLSSRVGEDWLTETRADEIRSLVADVLADAETRASLLQGGPTAGHDGHFYIASADGNYRLNLEGQLQVRFGYNHRDNNADEDRMGFEVRRAKLTFTGHVVDPTWQYTLTGAFSRKTLEFLTSAELDEDEIETSSDEITGPFELEDAYIEKDLGNGWSIRFGQFKMPFMREELVSSKRQLAVDRSMVNEMFNQDRSQGVQIGYKSEMFRAAGMYSDGFRMPNSPFLSLDTEYAFTGRGEVLLAGNWKQFDDFTSWKSDDFGAMVGFAAHFERGEFGDSSTEADLFTWTLDASIEFGGANLYGAIVGKHLDPNDGTPTWDQYGIVIQGGFFFTDDWEAFARYEWGDSDMAGAEDLSVFTIGVNRYFQKHNLKWTTDIGFGINEVSSTWASSGVGWRSDATDEDGQIVIRSQFQLLF